MDWETYYHRFYDWAESTQVNRISALTSFGESWQVAEVAQALMNEKAASRLIRKAIAWGVAFTPGEILDLVDCCDTHTAEILVAAANAPFTQEQLEDLRGFVGPQALEQAADRSHISGMEDPVPESAGKKRSAPFLMGFLRLLSRRKKPHPGRCTGDCDQCPPHYGYRYGRWYYGHSHSSGCEFGGNHGDGRD